MRAAKLPSIDSAATLESGKALHRTTLDQIREFGKRRGYLNGAMAALVHWVQDADEPPT